MPRSSARATLVPLLVLALGSLAPLPAIASDAPSKALRVPPEQDQLAELIAAIDPGVFAPLSVAVADAEQRLRASERAAAAGEGEPLEIREAVRAALREAGLGKRKGKGKDKDKALELLVDLAVLQLTVNVHAGLRESTGQQLAIRSVRACKGDPACLDAIVPTETMAERHITSVRKTFAGKTAELEAAERSGDAELANAGKLYDRMFEMYSKIMSNAHEIKKALIANFPR